MTQELFRFNGKAIAETEKESNCKGGLLIACEDGSEYWLPKAMIHDDSEVWCECQEGEVVIPLWLAEKKGIA